MEKLFFDYALVKRIEKGEISVNQVLSAIDDSKEYDFDVIHIVDYGYITVNRVDNAYETIFYVG